MTCMQRKRLNRYSGMRIMETQIKSQRLLTSLPIKYNINVSRFYFGLHEKEYLTCIFTKNESMHRCNDYIDLFDGNTIHCCANRISVRNTKKHWAYYNMIKLLTAPPYPMFLNEITLTVNNKTKWGQGNHSYFRPHSNFFSKFERIYQKTVSSRKSRGSQTFFDEGRIDNELKILVK